MNKRYALITGGLSVIGRSLALYLAREKYHVILHHFHSLNEEKINFLNNLKKEYPNKFYLIRKNLAKQEEVDELWKESTNIAEGTITVLINNASIFEKKTFQNLEWEDWDKHLDLNLKSPGRLITCFIKQNGFSREQPGHIVNLIDTYVNKTMVSYIPYVISKIGLSSLTKQSAKAAGGNFRINGISPGIVSDDNEKLIQRSVTKEKISPSEIARTCIFLISSKNITGEIIHVDGGKKLY